MSLPHCFLLRWVYGDEAVPLEPHHDLFRRLGVLANSPHVITLVQQLAHTVVLWIHQMKREVLCLGVDLALVSRACIALKASECYGILHPSTFVKVGSFPMLRKL